MKIKTFLRFFALTCAIVLSLVGCGTTVTEESVWIEGDGTTQTITHSSGNKGTANGEVDEFGRTDVNEIQNDGTAVDLKGATVTIGTYLTGYCGEPNPSSPTYQNEVDLISSIEKKYNCKIEFKYLASTAYYNAWTTAAQAGTHFADIIQIATSVIYPTHMKAGYLTQLDEYINAKDIIYNQNAMKQTTYNGKHYAVVMSNRLYSPKGLFFNKKIFSTFKQKTPDTYVKANNWTWDTFLECAKATTGNSNGVDYYGYGFAVADPTYWAISNGGKKVINKNGKYEFNMGSSQYLKGIQFVYDLYNTHKVTPTNVKSSKTLWQEGKVGMYLDYPGNGASHMEKIGSKNLGFTYIPKGPDAKEYIATTEETTAFAIPVTVKKPAAMAQILYDFTYPYKWRQTLEQQLESHMGDADSLKAAMDITTIANSNLDLMPMYPYLRSIGQEGFGILEQTSPQAYIASVSAAAQNDINSVWGQ